MWVCEYAAKYDCCIWMRKDGRRWYLPSHEANVCDANIDEDAAAGQVILCVVGQMDNAFTLFTLALYWFDTGHASTVPLYSSYQLALQKAVKDALWSVICKTLTLMRRCTLRWDHFDLWNSILVTKVSSSFTVVTFRLQWYSRSTTVEMNCFFVVDTNNKVRKTCWLIFHLILYMLLVTDLSMMIPEAFHWTQGQSGLPRTLKTAK